jgi:antitoxin component YwqK of YwqJK toxin-antitoxin module
MRIFGFIIMLACGIAFSKVNTTFRDGTSCECDSIHKVYWESGALMREIPFVNGKIHGTTEKRYYPSGEEDTIYEESQQRKDTKHLYKDETSCECDSIHKDYYESGALAWEVPFVNGKWHGIYKEYCESGRLASVSEYKNDVFQGYKKCADGRFGDESLDCYTKCYTN